MTPPRVELPRAGGATLLDLGLVPAARVHVEWAAAPSAVYFSDAALALMDRSDDADAVPAAKPVVPGGGGGEAPAAAPAAGGASKQQRKGKPSWLKM